MLSTVHSAKGKEWDAVFVIWAVDGWFPSSRSLEDEDELEEERRLMYVALTRARNRSRGRRIRSTSTRTRRGADYSIDQLSRFIDRGVREKMQRVVEEPSEAPSIRPSLRPDQRSTSERSCAAASRSEPQGATSVRRARCMAVARGGGAARGVGGLSAR